MAGLSIPSKCDSDPVISDLCRTLNPFLVVADDCEYIDQQTLKLQECPEAVPTGEMPRNIMLSGKLKYSVFFFFIIIACNCCCSRYCCYCCHYSYYCVHSFIQLSSYLFTHSFFFIHILSWASFSWLCGTGNKGFCYGYIGTHEHR